MQHRSTNPDWLYTDDLREVLGMSKTTLKRQLKAGNLPPHFQVGKRYVWRKDAIETWIADQEAKSARRKTEQLAAEQKAFAEARAQSAAIREQALNDVLADVFKNVPLGDETRTKIVALDGEC